jgi:hypothetical protein
MWRCRKLCIKKLRAVKEMQKNQSDAEKKRIASENKVPFTFFEKARWGDDTELDSSPKCGERFDWVAKFYALVDDPEVQVVAKRLKVLELGGGLLIIALEVYGLMSAQADNKAAVAGASGV